MDNLFEIDCVYIYGWIFQKVLAEIVQKDLILSQKGLISNPRNFGLFAPKSKRFPPKNTANRKISLIAGTFYERFFPSQKMRLKVCADYSMILTAVFRLIFVSLLRNTRVSPLVSGLN